MAQRPTKRQRTDEAREQARRTAELIAKQKQRRRIIVPLVTAAIAAVVVTIVIVAIMLWPKSKDTALPKPTGPAATAPSNMTSGGIAFTGANGKVVPVQGTVDWQGADADKKHIELFIDWTCPACRIFEERTADDILKLVTEGKATLQVYPLAVLRNNYTTDYADRAANAAACVAEFAPEKFLDVQAAMLAAQPPEEGTPGLTDDEIRDTVHGAGATGTALDACMADRQYANWVDQNTYRWSTDDSVFSTIDGRRGLATPTLRVNGKLWPRTQEPMEFINGER